MYVHSRPDLPGGILHPRTQEAFFRCTSKGRPMGDRVQGRALSLLKEADSVNITCNDLICITLQIGLALAHPFPSVADIIQSIPASAACFAKLDATHGYFQIPLDEEASKLTTFILSSGRYRYLRAPMGLSSSSDEWCRYSDRVVEGFPWCRKLLMIF